MLLLALETATDVCSAALHDGRRVLADASIRLPRSHGARLVPLVSDLFGHIGAAPQDLDAVAVSAGPGSYTGLRIGASTAKGLTFAADAALVAVPSLEAMAWTARLTAGAGDILAAFPSRRGEVYAALYRREHGLLVEERPPTALALEDLGAWCPGECTLVGPAAPAVADVLDGAGRGYVLHELEPSAVHVAALGLRKLRLGQTENVAAWEPFYLNAFVAAPPKPIFETRAGDG